MLQARNHEFRSMVKKSRAPFLAEEIPKKQVRFNLNEELGGEPTLPTSPTEARGTRSSKPPPQVDPGGNAEDPTHTLVENPDAQWQDDNVLLHHT